MRLGFLRQIPYCYSLSRQAAERGCLDGSIAQWPPAGVGGQPAQQRVQRAASDHVDFINGRVRQLLAEIDGASVRERETLQDATGNLGRCFWDRHASGP